MLAQIISSWENQNFCRLFYHLDFLFANFFENVDYAIKYEFNHQAFIEKLNNVFINIDNCEKIFKEIQKVSTKSFQLKEKVFSPPNCTLTHIYLKISE